jgi:hypothetical protein
MLQSVAGLPSGLSLSLNLVDDGRQEAFLQATIVAGTPLKATNSARVQSPFFTKDATVACSLVKPVTSLMLAVQNSVVAEGAATSRAIWDRVEAKKIPGYTVMTAFVHAHECTNKYQSTSALHRSVLRIVEAVARRFNGFQMAEQDTWIEDQSMDDQELNLPPLEYTSFVSDGTMLPGPGRWDKDEEPCPFRTARRVSHSRTGIAV